MRTSDPELLIGDLIQPRLIIGINSYAKVVTICWVEIIIVGGESVVSYVACGVKLHRSEVRVAWYQTW